MDPRCNAPTGRGSRRRAELVYAIVVHVVALAVYAAVVVTLVWVSDWDPLATNYGWSVVAIGVASWLVFAGGTVWLLRLVNLVRWWLQGRDGLVRRTITFDFLLWLGPWIGLLYPWKRSRRLIVPRRQLPPRTPARGLRRLTLLAGALVLGALVAVAVATRAWHRGPHPRLAEVTVRAGQSFGRRRIVFSFGSPDYRDVWVLAHGRLRQVSRRIRLAQGDDCYGDPSYGGSAGPCYQIAEPLAVSADGGQVAFFLQDTVPAPDTGAPTLIVSRSDGSDAHRIDSHLDFCVPCAPLSPPSWDRDGRSLVVSAPHGVATFERNVPEEDTDTALFRVDLRSQKTTALTNPRGVETYNDHYPVVSSDGRTIAFLRSASREPTGRSYADTLTHVYVMRANGTGPRRLPAPARKYGRLWWCGREEICATTFFSPQLTYRIDLRRRRIARLSHWAGASTAASSPEGSFVVEERKTGEHRFEVFAGRLSASGQPRVRPILVSSFAHGNPFGDFSVSGQ